MLRLRGGGKKADDDDDDDADEEAETEDTVLKGSIQFIAEKYGLKELNIDGIFEAFKKVGIMNADGLQLVLKTFKDTAAVPGPTDPGPEIYARLQEELNKLGVSFGFSGEAAVATRSTCSAVA